MRYDEAFAPPVEYTESIPAGMGRQFPLRLTIRTSKLPGAPYYLYRAYLPSVEKPILELISRPGKGDLIDALRRHK